MICQKLIIVFNCFPFLLVFLLEVISQNPLTCLSLTLFLLLSFLLLVSSSPKDLGSDPEENRYFLCYTVVHKQEFKLEMSEYRK